MWAGHSKKSAKKTARKSCEKTSFFKDLSHNGPTSGPHGLSWLCMLPTTSILTSRVFVGSEKVMRRADARATAYVEVALVGSIANSVTALETRTL